MKEDLIQYTLKEVDEKLAAIGLEKYCTQHALLRGRVVLNCQQIETPDSIGHSISEEEPMDTLALIKGKESIMEECDFYGKGNFCGECSEAVCVDCQEQQEDLTDMIREQMLEDIIFGR